MLSTVLNLFLSFLFRLHLPILRKILKSSIKSGNVKVVLPGNEAIQCGNVNSSQKATILLHKPARALLRMIPDAKIGFSEAYMHGEFDAEPSLEALISILMKNENSMKDEAKGAVYWAQKLFFTFVQYCGRFYNYVLHLWRHNSLTGSRQNIKEHYDVGNDFYASFMDESMTYSCAFYKSENDSLNQAQMNKFDMIVEKLGITSQDHVLEIGCGWGPFAIRAVQQTGCKWTGVTISQEQIAFGVKRVAELGLEDKIDLRMQDYRLVAGQFDKIVSLEMLEHVGHDYMPGYFEVVNKCLKPGGKACIQVMTWPDETYDSYRKSSDFFKKHLSPGLNLPSIGAIKDALPPGLEWKEHYSFGKHYATTLLAWIERMHKAKDEILAMGYSEYFFRKWDFFFRSCVTLFGEGYCDVIQFVLEKN